MHLGTYTIQKKHFLGLIKQFDKNLFQILTLSWYLTAFIRHMRDFRVKGFVVLFSILADFQAKVEKILKGSLDLIPSPLPSVKIQIWAPGGKVYLRY